MSNKLIQIEVAKLYPHPKNPRLDVGDVTELAESIKVKGILQNLTVIVERYRIQKLTECINKNTLQTLFLQAYLNLEDSENIRNYHYWNCEYCKSALMSRIYAGLKVLGYQISDEEQKYIDGTHELFMKEQNDD